MPTPPRRTPGSPLLNGAKTQERALELLADIAFHSTFPEAELDKERDVILDEIAGVRDQPGDVIFESFEGGLFQGHALAAPILGNEESVMRLTRDQVQAYVARHYRPDNMVLGVVGSASWQKVLLWAEKHFGGQTREAVEKGVQRKAPESCEPFQLVEPQGVHQVHHISGCMAPGEIPKTSWP